MKIRPVGAELFYADGRTDGTTDRWTNMTKLIVAFRNFANALKKRKVCTFAMSRTPTFLLSTTQPSLCTL